MQSHGALASRDDDHCMDVPKTSTPLRSRQRHTSFRQPEEEPCDASFDDTQSSLPELDIFQTTFDSADHTFLTTPDTSSLRFHQDGKRQATPEWRVKGTSPDASHIPLKVGFLQTDSQNRSDDSKGKVQSKTVSDTPAQHTARPTQSRASIAALPLFTVGRPKSNTIVGVPSTFDRSTARSPLLLSPETSRTLSPAKGKQLFQSDFLAPKDENAAFEGENPAWTSKRILLRRKTISSGSPESLRSPSSSGSSPGTPNSDINTEEAYSPVAEYDFDKACDVEVPLKGLPDGFGEIMKDFKRLSPRKSPRVNHPKQLCQLCGAYAARFTILHPCMHLACAICCSSGINQVSTSPPRRHVCGACQTPVESISLQALPESLAPESSSPAGRNGDVLAPLRAGYPLVPTQTTPDIRKANTAAVYESTASKALISFDTSSACEKFLADHPIFSQDMTQSDFIIRVDNIPWSAGYSEVRSWIPDAKEILAPNTIKAQAIHIPIEFKTGKTANACFIECSSRESAWKLIRDRNNSRLCGRPVSLVMSSVDELLDDVFPMRRLTKIGDCPDSEETVFFTSRQLQSLSILLRDGSLQLKGHIKPVEYMISLVQCSPSCLSFEQRDILFERVMEMVALCIPVRHDFQDLSSTVDRLLAAVIGCPAFTVTQRLRVVQRARELLETHHGGPVEGVPVISMLASRMGMERMGESSAYIGQDQFGKRERSSSLMAPLQNSIRSHSNSNLSSTSQDMSMSSATSSLAGQGSRLATSTGSHRSSPSAMLLDPSLARLSNAHSRGAPAESSASTRVGKGVLALLGEPGRPDSLHLTEEALTQLIRASGNSAAEGAHARFQHLNLHQTETSRQLASGTFGSYRPAPAPGVAADAVLGHPSLPLELKGTTSEFQHLVEAVARALRQRGHH